MTTTRPLSIALLAFAVAACGGPGPGPGGGPTPGPPPAPTQVSAGIYHSLALTDDGRAYAWGWNLMGELGTGDTTPAPTPVAVSMPSGVRFAQVEAGGLHSIALTDDGRAYAWGNNSDGAIGDGSNTDRHTPVPVAMPVGTTLVNVSSSGSHALAVTDDGRVFGWGFNVLDQVGAHAPSPARTPVEVPFPDGVVVTDVATGGGFSLALDEVGTVYAWGTNTMNQLGDGTTDPRGAPRPVAMPDDAVIVAIAAGSSFGLALDADGGVYAWGENFQSWLGAGDFSSPVRLDLPAGLAFTEIHAGSYLAVGRTADGVVHAWGRNNGGQVGDGTTVNRTTPVQVALPAGVRAERVDVGQLHSLALGDDGRVYAWGDDFGIGRIGDGRLENAPTPVAIDLP